VKEIRARAVFSGDQHAPAESFGVTPEAGVILRAQPPAGRRAARSRRVRKRALILFMIDLAFGCAAERNLL